MNPVVAPKFTVAPKGHGSSSHHAAQDSAHKGKFSEALREPASGHAHKRETVAAPHSELIAKLAMRLADPAPQAQTTEIDARAPGAPQEIGSYEDIGSHEDAEAAPANRKHDREASDTAASIPTPQLGISNPPPKTIIGNHQEMSAESTDSAGEDAAWAMDEATSQPAASQPHMADAPSRQSKIEHRDSSAPTPSTTAQPPLARAASSDKAADQSPPPLISQTHAAAEPNTSEPASTSDTEAKPYRDLLAATRSNADEVAPVGKPASTDRRAEAVTTTAPPVNRAPQAHIDHVPAKTGPNAPAATTLRRTENAPQTTSQSPVRLDLKLSLDDQNVPMVAPSAKPADPMPAPQPTRTARKSEAVEHAAPPHISVGVPTASSNTVADATDILREFGIDQPEASIQPAANEMTALPNAQDSEDIRASSRIAANIATIFADRHLPAVSKQPAETTLPAQPQTAPEMSAADTNIIETADRLPEVTAPTIPENNRKTPIQVDDEPVTGTDIGSADEALGRESSRISRGSPEKVHMSPTIRSDVQAETKPSDARLTDIDSADVVLGPDSSLTLRMSPEKVRISSTVDLDIPAETKPSDARLAVTNSTAPQSHIIAAPEQRHETGTAPQTKVDSNPEPSPVMLQTDPNDGKREPHVTTAIAAKAEPSPPAIVTLAVKTAGEIGGRSQQDPVAPQTRTAKSVDPDIETPATRAEPAPERPSASRQADPLPADPADMAVKTSAPATLAASVVGSDPQRKKTASADTASTTNTTSTVTARTSANVGVMPTQAGIKPADTGQLHFPPTALPAASTKSSAPETSPDTSESGPEQPFGASSDKTPAIETADDRSETGMAVDKSAARLPDVPPMQRLAPTAASVVTPLVSHPAVTATLAKPAAPHLAQPAAVSSTTHSLQIQLRPHEMGIVTATLRMADDRITVELATERVEAYEQLNKDSDSIVKALRGVGLQVDQITIQPPQPASTPKSEGGMPMHTSGGREQQFAQAGDSSGGSQGGQRGAAPQGENDNAGLQRQAASPSHENRAGGSLVI